MLKVIFSHLLVMLKYQVDHYCLFFCVCVLSLAAFSASAKNHQLSHFWVSFTFYASTPPPFLPLAQISPFLCLLAPFIAVLLSFWLEELQEIRGKKAGPAPLNFPLVFLLPSFSGPGLLSRCCLFSSLTWFCLQVLRLSLLLWQVVALVSSSAQGNCIMHKLRAAVVSFQLSL